MPISSGDTAWILVSSALVMLMTPGVALFYGGMVRRKNVLSTLMMSFAALALAMLLGPRKGFRDGEPMEPNNIPMVMLGAGLVAIRPAAGFVSPLMGIPIGMGAAVVCYLWHAPAYEMAHRRIT